MLTDVMIPLLTYPDQTPVRIVDRMLNLADTFARSIHVCAVEIDIPDVRPALRLPVINVEALTGQAASQSKAIGASLLAAARANKLKAALEVDTICIAPEQVAPALSRMARYHDLTMLAVDKNSAEKRSAVESIVFESGRPALVVPEDNSSPHKLDHVAIAWDGSRSASRAVDAAMPLITAAKDVTLLSAFFDKDIDRQSIDELKAYLVRHGVASSHHEVDVPGPTIGLALQEAALARGAGLLVMGAYGHSRLRDFILGGATRTTLDDLRLPVMLSH